MSSGQVLQRSAIGLGRSELEAALRAGRLSRVTHGWYAVGEPHPDVVRAVRLGTRLTCLSAAQQYGLWVPMDRRLHVAVRKSDAAPAGSGLVIHRMAAEGWGTKDPVLPLTVCLDHILRHHAIEAGLTVLESAVENGLVSVATAVALLTAQPVRRRIAGLQHFDPRSGSGSETRVRLWLQRRRVPVRSQVMIVGVGRVDLLVGESWVIETDSVAHHTTVDRYEADRTRDLELSALGFQVLRLTQRQVFAEWPATIARLKAILSQGHYRRPPSPEAICYLPELRRLAA